MKVICSECHYQANRWCSVKKSTVSLNKKRVCDKYKLDVSKIKQKHAIPTVYRSDWIYKKKELKQLLKEQKEREEAQVKEAKTEKRVVDATNPPRYLNPNPVVNSHPLTGDLSRFTSTANKED
jgi:hypothetical protein